MDKDHDLLALDGTFSRQDILHTIVDGLRDFIDEDEDDGGEAAVAFISQKVVVVDGDPLDKATKLLRHQAGWGNAKSRPAHPNVRRSPRGEDRTDHAHLELKVAMGPPRDLT